MTTSISIDASHLVEWIERELGGKVVGLEPHARWRPAWFMEWKNEGRITQLYARGERGQGLHTQPLEREYAVLNLLGDNGVPTPKIYGWCPEPKTIVMEHVIGTPYEGGAEGHPDIWACVANYMTHLAKVHQIDVNAAVDAGLHCPKGPEEIALTYFAKAERAYEEGKDGPDALVEFSKRWIKRHIPTHRTGAAVVTCDAPQFFYRNGEVAALFDLELAQIGDPMMDLASMRLRDTMEPTGNLGKLFNIYAEAIGEELDFRALGFYTVMLFMCVSMIAAPSLRSTRPHPGFIEYLSWCMSTTRCTMQAMAEYVGFELDEVDPIEPRPSHRSDAFDELVAQCELQKAEGHYREPPLLSLARYVQQSDAYGAELDQLELADAQALLGKSLTNLSQAESELERFVQSASPEADVQLINFFYRRETRRLILLDGYPSPIVNRGMGSLAPLQATDDSA